MELELQKSGSKQYLFAAMDRPEQITVPYSLSELVGKALSARNAVFRSNLEPFASFSESNVGTIYVLPNSWGLSVNGQVFEKDGAACRFRRLTLLVK